MLKLDRQKNSQVEEIEKILSSLANRDSINIFKAARDGITSSTKTIKELKLTQKRYYTRLGQLTEAGLIEKKEDTYQQTLFGKLCFSLGEKFYDAIIHRDRLDLMDRLNKSSSISQEETKQISRALSTGSIGGFTEADLISNVRVADSYEKLVSDVIEYVDRAKEKIYFASKYFDVRVVEALLRCLQKGVEMVFLSGDPEEISNRINVLRTMITNPKLLQVFFSFMVSPDLKVRVVDLPYTFIVIDGKDAMIEVTKPYTEAFSMAFFFSDEKLSERLIETFEVLWKRGSDMKGTLLETIPKNILKKLKESLKLD